MQVIGVLNIVFSIAFRLQDVYKEQFHNPIVAVSPDTVQILIWPEYRGSSILYTSYACTKSGTMGPWVLRFYNTFVFFQSVLRRFMIDNGLETL